ncbi:MAG: hypothetical protein KF773_00630 [Deltaproteobacteria bacterium]|nr:hypothetical protein [Deltaproteobacteria bacterium]MCW5801296.1 hypothetical protein [Deltaproteobacteria bacterium]
MHAVRTSDRSHAQVSPIRILGALLMLAGAVMYLADQGARSWHLFTWPALVTMGFGALLAFVGGERCEG